jgi:hypothetical protein
MEDDIMKKKVLKKMLPMLLFVIPAAIIGGYFTGRYTLEHTTDVIMKIIMENVPNENLFYVITTLQSFLYAIFATVIGYFLADRVGLVKPFKLEKSILMKVVPIIVVLGIVFAGDYFVFGKLIPEVAADYEKGISISYFIASLTYGGVVEEVLLRWFFMTLIAWGLVMIFARKVEKESIPVWIFAVANVVAALVFAAGHLPATQMFFGTITPLILLRCFLLNGGFAIVFGRYYRKYGIQYAMLAHFGLHLISKTILLLVIK